MKAKQTGFTLIELIVVIVILGILAATALPRYAALQTQARIAKLNGAYGSVKGTAAMAHGSCLAQQTAPICDGVGLDTIAMEGVNINMRFQYPTASAGANGIIVASGIDTADPTQGFITQGGGNGAGATISVRVNGGSNPATCAFTYSAPTGANLSPVITAPVTGGC